MVSHHPAKFSVRKYSLRADIMFLTAEEEDFRCCGFNPLFLFISKGHGLKIHGIHY